MRSVFLAFTVKYGIFYDRVFHDVVFVSNFFVIFYVACVIHNPYTFSQPGHRLNLMFAC